jgi:hypothetical protein
MLDGEQPKKQLLITAAAKERHFHQRIPTPAQLVIYPKGSLPFAKVMKALC